MCVIWRGLVYSKNPHIRTWTFRGQVEQVLIFQGRFLQFRLIRFLIGSYFSEVVVA